MTTDYPTDEVTATPEYVLEVFRDWHRIAGVAGAAVPLELTFDTPIRDWEESLATEPWGSAGLGAAMNEAWDIDLPPERWREFDTVAATLGDLCRVIAFVATRPVIRPWKHIAGECLPAGVFLTLRSMLTAAGEDPERITPSAPLAPYLARRMGEFWCQFARLTPGSGPLPTHPKSVRSLVSWILLGGLGCTVLDCAGVGPPWVLAVVGGGLIHGGLLLHRLTIRWHFPHSRIFTFRDLAYHLAGQEPRRRIQPIA